MTEDQKVRVAMIEDVTDEELANSTREAIIKLIDMIRESGHHVDFACFLLIPNTKDGSFVGSHFATIPPEVTLDFARAVVDGHYDEVPENGNGKLN